VGAYGDADITEIHGADNLLEPEGIIRGLQGNLADLYGSDQSFILVNGSTVGIEAAILHLGPVPVIMARNSHRSAYSGLILSGGAPHYIFPEITADNMAGAIAPQAVEKALVASPEASAVFITSPTFEGYCSDIVRIAEIVHKRGKLLIVDEAHGAHFGFHPAFPKNASRMGADIVIQSLHKTLPAPGQCSVLHINGKRVDTDNLKAGINILQTSSPSYFFMPEIERCAGLLRENGTRLFEEYYARLRWFYGEMEKLKLIRLLTDTGDPGKLTFCMNGRMNGVEFGRLLRERRMELEMCLPSHAVAMTSIADTDEGFKRLADAVIAVDDSLCDEIVVGASPCHPCNPVYKADHSIGTHGAQRAAPPTVSPSVLFSPREAFFSTKRTVSLKDAEGMISGDFIIPYPPGIPLVAPGESISGEIISEVRRLLSAGADVLGADKISVLVK